jgi:pimeloyl-ACP methyl ester carboxylesterase
MCQVRLGTEIRFSELTGGDPTGGRLGQIRCPVLIVRGEHDHMMPRATTEALTALLPHAEIHELPGGDHFVPQSAPDWLNPILIDWFARHPIEQPATAT